MPIRVSKHVNDQLEIDLLLLNDGEKFHYVLITNLMNLVSFITKRTAKSSDKLCRNCFYICSSAEVLERHSKTCLHNEPAVVRMPSERQSKIIFRNLKARWFAPIVLYFDLESLLQPVSTCCNEKQMTETVELHKPCSFCLVAVEYGNPEPVFVRLERSENCMSQLVTELQQIARDVYEKKRSHKYFRGRIPPEAGISIRMLDLQRSL